MLFSCGVYSQGQKRLVVACQSSTGTNPVLGPPTLLVPSCWVHTSELCPWELCVLLRLIPGRTLFGSPELTLETGEQDNTGRLVSADRRVLGCNKNWCRKLLYLLMLEHVPLEGPGGAKEEGLLGGIVKEGEGAA